MRNVLGCAAFRTVLRTHRISRSLFLIPQRIPASPAVFSAAAGPAPHARPAASKHHTRMQHAAPCIACGARGYSGRVLLSDVPSPPHVGLCPTTTESRLRLTRSCARAHTRPESERASEERERRGGGGEKEREGEIERAYLFSRASCSSHC